nr:ATP-binding protein [Pseudoalteromonas sp. C2R02]
MAKQVIADKVLLEQVLVNLIKNAIEASETGQSVLLQSQEKDNGVEIMVIDSGAGISNFDDLFVPFYTTKKTGKGIGLSLSRNMLEQQGGKLTLHNRTVQQGVQAVIYLRNNKKQIK